MTEAMLKRLLKSIRRRKSRASGISTAASHMRAVESCASDRRFWKFINQGSAASWAKAFEESRSKLTYFDPELHTIKGGYRPDPDKKDGAILHFGEPRRKDATKNTDGACMDFECILTSRRKDRDSDILHPDGAEVDPKMPLLWQHIPMEPIGRLCSVLDQNDKQVDCHFSIIDSPLGRDAAALVAFGALRISHGFQPIKFKPLEEDGEETDMFAGWEIEKYKVMEGSLVSIPSNEDAIITAYSREKLHSPLIKSWAKGHFERRPVIVTGGYDAKSAGGVNVTVNVDLGNKGKKEDETGDDSKDGDEGGESSEPVTVQSILDKLDEAAGAGELPKEAASRIEVLRGMLEGLQEQMAELTEAVSAAADAQDIAGMFAGMKDMIEGVMGQLGKLCAELDTIAGIEDMPEGAAAALSDARGMVEGIQSQMTALADSAADAEEEGEETEEGDELPEDEEEEDDEEEEAKEGEEEEDKEEDEDDEEAKEEPAYGDDDKEDDEEDEDEKEGEEEDKDDEEESEEKDGDSEDDEDDEDEKDALEADDSNDDSMNDPDPDEGAGRQGSHRPNRKMRAKADDLALKLTALIVCGYLPSPTILAQLSETLDESVQKAAEKVLAG